MTVGLQDLTRGNLSERVREVLSRGSRRNPDVFVALDGGRPVVVKDFSPRGAFVRATIGRWITARELRAYRHLRGHAHVPRLLGSLDALAFAVEYRPGRRMSRKLAGNVPEGFFGELQDAVAGLHAEGIAHLDLSHRSNVLVDEGGHPVLIDFASAVRFRPGGLAARLVLPWLARFDRRALEKWRVRLGAAEEAA